MLPTPLLPGQTPPDRSPVHQEHQSPPHSVGERKVRVKGLEG